MKDDITRVQISKVDIATGKELPGAELIIKDKDGNTVAQWVSEDKPHYIEKLPAGDYKLTEITAPNGYQIAESISKSNFHGIFRAYSKSFQKIIAWYSCCCCRFKINPMIKLVS